MMENKFWKQLQSDLIPYGIKLYFKEPFQAMLKINYIISIHQLKFLCQFQRIQEFQLEMVQAQTDDILESLCALIGTLQQLKTFKYTGQHNLQLCQYLDRIPQIKDITVEIAKCLSLEDKETQHQLEIPIKNRWVERLNLRFRVSNTFKIMGAEEMVNLKEVYLQICRSSQSDSALVFLNSLKDLNVRQAGILEEHPNDLKSLHHFPCIKSLKRLKLVIAGQTDKGIINFSSLSELTNLESLKLRLVQNQFKFSFIKDIESINTLANLKNNLNTLELFFQRYQFASIKDFSFLKELSQLKSLILRFNQSEITDGDLSSIKQLSKLPQLTTLQLELGKLPPETNLKAIASFNKMPKLESLKITLESERLELRPLGALMMNLKTKIVIESRHFNYNNTLNR